MSSVMGSLVLGLEGAKDSTFGGLVFINVMALSYSSCDTVYSKL